VIDGFVRYADKPNNPELPRPRSEELKEFYREQAAAVEKRKSKRK
jgi:hypothetical protein